MPNLPSHCFICGGPLPCDTHGQKPKSPAFLKSLFSVAHDMAAVQRFSRIRMVHPENVLQHTGMVCLFAYAIACRTMARAPRELKPLDIGLVMCRAVAHDLDETITGDIVRPTKYFSEALRGELRKLEQSGIKSIGDAFGDEYLAIDWRNAKNGREGFIVKLADLLAAACTVYTEVRVTNNFAMVQPAPRMLGLLGDMRNFLGSQTIDFSIDEQIELGLVIEEGERLLNEVAYMYSTLPSVHKDA